MHKIFVLENHIFRNSVTSRTLKSINFLSALCCNVIQIAVLDEKRFREFVHYERGASHLSASSYDLGLIQAARIYVQKKQTYP